MEGKQAENTRNSIVGIKYNRHDEMQSTAFLSLILFRILASEI